MTAPLRRQHLAMWLALAVLMILVLVAALAGRKPALVTNDQLRWESLK